MTKNTKTAPPPPATHAEIMVTLRPVRSRAVLVARIAAAIASVADVELVDVHADTPTVGAS